ncbi:uncharacterized protein LOC131237040 isoform X11 [Magnolia sinica]|uniref:uncharacterized protein LOC131237040 isoform X11 n=1 Tax=Magnolia sinica TaxID=86752 RepID=UPI00265AE679|nr:uncharacterized protein LOC131237040 isoform X11 [Magnolia sinica]
MENTETLREWFERVDSEKTSSITALQLKSAFAVGNLEFSLSVVQQMIRMYDFDRNGTMSFEGAVDILVLRMFMRALIKTRRAGSGWMILYHSVYLYSQLGIYLIRLIQLSRGESRWISTSLFTALPIAEYEINFSSLEDHSA